MIKFKVIPDDGESYELEATSRDVYLWERVNRTGRVFADLAERQSMTDMSHVAFLAAERRGLFTGTLDEFRATCDLEQMEGNASAVDPTPPARSAGRSSGSRSRRA